MFAYCNNNPANYYDDSGSLACQNTMRMSNDGGGEKYRLINVYYGGIDTNEITYEYRVTSDGEIAVVNFLTLVGIANNSRKAFKEYGNMIETVNEIGGDTGKATKVAGKFLFKTVGFVLGFVDNFVGMISASNDYANGNDVIITLHIPFSLKNIVKTYVDGIVTINTVQ